MDCPNSFLVGVNGDSLVITLWGKKLSRDEAINLAVWLAVLADPIGDKFKETREAVLSC